VDRVFFFASSEKNANLQEMLMNRVMIRKVVVAVAWLMLCMGTYAQNEVVLHINHLINGEHIVIGDLYNVEGDQVRVDRLEYYLCEFVITHDGGQITELNDVYVLADVNDDGVYSLGEWDITNIEGIAFGAGVDSNHNVGIDPSTYPSGHPLAPQFPSMHWGWASGYRFLALEGFAGDNLNAQYQIHALGDNNFFLQNHDLNAEEADDVVTMYLNANYEGLFDGLPVSQGFIEHSSSGEATEAMQNMANLVFEAGTTMGSEELPVESTWTVYPNPSSDVVFVDAATSEAYRWQLINMQGQVVSEGVRQGRSALDVQSVRPGCYFLRLQTNRSASAETQRLFIR
jgi:hypothetical protein